MYLFLAFGVSSQNSSTKLHNEPRTSLQLTKEALIFERILFMLPKDCI